MEMYTLHFTQSQTLRTRPGRTSSTISLRPGRTGSPPSPWNTGNGPSPRPFGRASRFTGVRRRRGAQLAGEGGGSALWRLPRHEVETLRCVKER